MIGLGLNTAADTSHPTLFGGLPAETQNYSVYLDGASDRIQGPNMSTTWLQVFDANVEFSLHFSIKLDALNSTLSFTGTSSNFFWMQVLADGNLTIQASISSSSVGAVTFATGMSTGTWYDIVITATNDTTRVFKCYVNKSEVSVTTTTAFAASTDVAAIAGKFTLGTFLNVIDYDFRLDRLASWSTVLTAAEVTEIYDNYPDLTADSGNYAESARLVTYYKMEEGSGTTMADSSGNGHSNLTVVNATGNFWSTDTRI
mgnify:CR=1 FL=1